MDQARRTHSVTLTPVVLVRISDADALAKGVAAGVMTGLAGLCCAPSVTVVLFAAGGSAELFALEGAAALGAN